jgi:NADH-quinone oxidoreductase subunit E
MPEIIFGVQPMKDANSIQSNPFSESALIRIRELMMRYPEGKQKSALIPVLHIVQEENGGWLSAGVMDDVARLLGISSIEVYEVATFYSQFNLKRVGRYVLEICRTGPCCNVGAERLISHVEKKLGIRDGETTPDGLFTLKTVECLGACGYGPVIQVGERYYENLNEEKIDAMLENFKSVKG